MEITLILACLAGVTAGHDRLVTSNQKQDAVDRFVILFEEHSWQI